MLKKMLLMASCVMIFLPTTGSTDNRHILQMGSGYVFELPAKSPQVMSNPFIWEVKADCIIDAKVDMFDVSFQVTRKKGTLNGRKMSTGELIILSFSPHDKVKITAQAGAEVILTNLGDSPAYATCLVS